MLQNQCLVNMCSYIVSVKTPAEAKAKVKQEESDTQQPCVRTPQYDDASDQCVSIALGTIILTSIGTIISMEY